jgi:hypothetical protein
VGIVAGIDRTQPNDPPLVKVLATQPIDMSNRIRLDDVLHTFGADDRLRQFWTNLAT